MLAWAGQSTAEHNFLQLWQANNDADEDHDHGDGPPEIKQHGTPSFLFYFVLSHFSASSSRVNFHNPDLRYEFEDRRGLPPDP